MSDLNNYSFTGRLGKDAEVKFLQNGTAVWSASIGTGYGYGDNKGTNWLRVSVFGKRAESLGKLDLAKGTHVAIAGELRLREYEKDGEKRWAHEVTANDVTLLGGKSEGGGSSGSRGGAPQRESRQAATSAPVDDFGDSEIPFVSQYSNF